MTNHFLRLESKSGSKKRSKLRNKYGSKKLQEKSWKKRRKRKRSRSDAKFFRSATYSVSEIPTLSNELESKKRKWKSSISERRELKLMR